MPYINGSFVEHSAGCCAILLAKMLIENYKTSEGKQHDGRLKSTEMMKKNSTTINRNLQKE